MLIYLLKQTLLYHRQFLGQKMKYNAPVTTMRAEIDQKGFARILQDVESSCKLLQDSKHFAGFYKIAILLQDS